jgi:YVTN family beta-propeller protein
MRKHIGSRGTLLGVAGPLVAVLVGAGMASCGGNESTTGETTSTSSTGSSSATGSSSSGQTPPVDPYGTTVSSSLALSSDDHTLWVVNQDADSVSVIDVDKRTILAEIPLGSKAPALDPTTKRFDPAVMPRALAMVSDKKVYVVGEAANRVYVLDAEKHTILTSIAVPAAPVSVAAAPDGSAVYVVSNEAAKVTKIDTTTDTVVKSLDVTEHPWGASVSADGASLYVTHILLDPGMSVVDTAALTLRGKVPLADEPRSTPFEKRLPNGEARGLYEAVPNPKSGEIWIPHLLLGVKTPQPDLDFESTVFPTISTIKADGSAEGKRLVFQPNIAGAKGSFADSVCGPRAVSFTPDGKLALVALGQSEDVMVFDTEAKVEVALVRPLPSAMLEGILVDHSGKHAYVNGRNTHDVTVLAIDEANSIVPVAVDGKPIELLKKDPMPADLRHGQRLFYTANSAKFPITKNFWVACTSCHIEGGSDAVTWLFKEGPRDTPSNAGGPINTGFLLHQALRSDVNQYDETIQAEQGGTYTLNEPSQKADLDALALYVNYGISLPQNPYLAADGKLNDAQSRGQKTFASVCVSCHGGPFYTDSAMGNTGLDFNKPILLHDLGTCVKTGAFPDKPGLDVTSQTHTACAFDTPTLRGVFATAPYLHDGSARTLLDVVKRLPPSADLPAADQADLVEYLKTL